MNPGPIKTTTTAFLIHLLFTALAAAAFAGLDYIANHGTINYQQLLIFVSGAVIVSLLLSLRTFYQAQGDQTTADAFAQVSAAIQALEQRFLQVQHVLQVQHPPQVLQGVVPPNMSIPVALSAERRGPPMAPGTPDGTLTPRFSLPSTIDRPAGYQEMSPPVPPGPPQDAALFTLTGPDMEERLSSFPFRQS